MVTERLARFVVETDFDHLPGEVAEQAKFPILDCFGVMLAGSIDPIGKLITQFVETMGGNPRSSVIGAGFKTSPPNAAFANGTMGHALDFDDDHDTLGGHPSVVILPAILALAEEGASGKDVLAAYVLGLEVAVRIASVPGFMPDHYARGWHATSTIGVLGAAAASAKILNLDVEQTRNAFGISASEASGLKANFGTMAKPFHAGSAARKGVTAAWLAKCGFVTNQRIFESPYGFLSVLGGKEALDCAPVTEDLGQSFGILSPGVNIKKYPCCYFTHSAIDVLLSVMKEQNLMPHDVRGIRCGLHGIAVKTLIHQMPRTGLEGKFNLPYCLAVALVKRELRLEDFQDVPIRDERIKENMGKVKVYEHPDLREIETHNTVVVDIETKKGETHTVRLETPSGSGRSPLPWEIVVSKFRTCASLVLDEKRSDRVVGHVERFETLSDIRGLMEILSGVKEV